VNNDIVLQVSNLKKRFKIYKSPWGMLKEWVTFGKRSYHKDFWALKGVSFDIHKGEFVGIIGPNGAGKSTLLRIITDVLRATEGSYRINGRVLSILELSGGTDSDLTGRENVIRSGQMMGFPDGYVEERMERIKEFSELEDFFEQPLRMYSTGMKTRLSFSMFAFMDMDILILDEVLAVGDIFFKQKCFARLAELIERKTAIILVTHSMGIIQHYCNRVILLNNGEKIFDGENAEAIRQFLLVHGENRAKTIGRLVLDEEESLPSLSSGQTDAPVSITELDAWPGDNAFKYNSFPKFRGKGKASLIRMAVMNDQGEPTLVFRQGERLHVYCEFQLKEDVAAPVVNVEIRDRLNLLVHSKNSAQNRAESPSAVSRSGVIRYHQVVTLNLAPDNYVFGLDCFSMPQKDGTPSKKPVFPVAAGNVNRLWRLEQAFAIAILPGYGAQSESLHGGLCDLPGESQMQLFA
jgi:lipopolysaccharide transport system ATP-binding protein